MKSLLFLIVIVAPAAALGDDLTDCLAAHNAARCEHKMDSLRLDGRLAAAAQEHANWMARVGVLTHVRPRGLTWFSRAKRAGYDCTYITCSENIASGPAEHMDGATATDCWLKSKVGHRDNVLGSWHHVGFGVARGRDGKRYWCALYANPGTVMKKCQCVDCKCEFCNCGL
jgi:uncharacterized protein YkwD